MLGGGGVGGVVCGGARVRDAVAACGEPPHTSVLALRQERRLCAPIVVVVVVSVCEHARSHLRSVWSWLLWCVRTSATEPRRASSLMRHARAHGAIINAAQGRELGRRRGRSTLCCIDTS